jgi:hypothetical protein
MTLAPERRPGRTIAAITVLFALAYGASLVVLAKPGGRIVFGDALQHYIQLRSIVFDGDVKFTNDYLGMYGETAEQANADPETRWIVEPDETGHVRNLMPIGPAILWLPAFLIVTAGVWIANLFGAGYPFDGFGRVFQASAGFSGIAAAGLGAWLAFRAAATIASERAAFWATIAVWLASSSVYYSVVSPTYSHAASMLSVSGFWLAWIVTRDRHDLRRYALVGALAGVAALMRWQDAMLIAVPAWDAVRRWRDGVPRTIARLAAAGAAGALAFVPQSIVWLRLYRHPLTIPQGSTFMHWTSPALWQVLFSDNHGLFSWTPVLVLAIAGIFVLARRSPGVAVVIGAFLLVSWYVNAAAADWWAGEAFGARRFVACFPVFVIGLAALFDRWRDRPRVMIAITAGFVAYTFLLLVQYQTFMHGLRTVAPYPKGAYALWLARFVVPFSLAQRWLLR